LTPRSGAGPTGHGGPPQRSGRPRHPSSWGIRNGRRRSRSTGERWGRLRRRGRSPADWR
jgi:hypothetical protein